MKLGVLLVWLGTPEAPTVSAVRRFTRDFLSDPRVVEIPRIIWWPLLHGVILPFRPRRTAKAYAELWKHYGDSPLRRYSQAQCERLAERLLDRYGDCVSVAHAASYGRPSIAERLEMFQRDGVDHVVVLPLYPQYSATTTAAVFDQVARTLMRLRDMPGLSVIRGYHDHPMYIDALAASVEAHWREHGRSQRLLLSFHGIPQRNVDLGDPYFKQAQETCQLLSARLGLKPDQWGISFQSRLGRARWLQPYTSELLREWGELGVDSVDVICPAFASDCLETVEEIAIENRDIFLEAGGKVFRYIPCLNDQPLHIDLLQCLCERYLATPLNEKKLPDESS